jgi:hypothetical protein
MKDTRTDRARHEQRAGRDDLRDRVAEHAAEGLRRSPTERQEDDE